jgi:bisanhydrobacterioruberin hydratase
VLNRFTKNQIATAIAVFFHSVGLAGLLFTKSQFFTVATPLNLLLSVALLIWCQQNKNRHFMLFVLLCLAVGFTAELLGVNYGILFGDYFYGKVLGPQVNHVPVIIGVNWFIIVYCCGISVHTLFSRLIQNVAVQNGTAPKALKALSVLVDGATLAVFFDWLMEPVAVKLGYWTWNGEIPLFNYVCWFAISFLLLGAFHIARFNKQNKFAVNLLLIQLMFFLILRTFLT